MFLPVLFNFCYFNKNDLDHSSRLYFFGKLFFLSTINVPPSIRRTCPDMTQPPGAGVKLQRAAACQKEDRSRRGVVSPAGARIKREYW